MAKSNLPVVYVEQESILPDNAQWTNRLEIHSESSDRIYIIAQHKTKRYWGCSCMAWRRYRHCKHLDHLQLPNCEKPYEVQIART